MDIFLIIRNCSFKILIPMVLLIFETACVSIDGRIDTEQVNPNISQSLDARFSIYPSYSSSMEKDREFPKELGQLYKYFDRVDHIKTIDSINLYVKQNESLTIKFLADNKSVGGGTYTLSDGLEFDGEGRILLPGKIQGFFLGGGLRQATLYLNSGGDLVITQSISSGGILLLILPWISYITNMYIFPRI